MNTMTPKNTMLVLLASICLLTLPATTPSWGSGDDDDDDGFEDFFAAFFDKLFQQLKKMKHKIKANMMAIADHEIRITALESITVVNGTDGQDGADGLNGINGTNGIDGIDGMDGIDGINGTDGIDGAQGIQGIPGVNGTDGTDGQDGADGMDGVDGEISLYKVVETSTILPGYNVYEASCDPGDYAIAGGYTVDAPNNEATDIFIDRDNGDGVLFGEMWTVGLLDDGNFDPPADITVTAVCQDNP